MLQEKVIKEKQRKVENPKLQKIKVPNNQAKSDEN